MPRNSQAKGRAPNLLKTQIVIVLVCVGSARMTSPRLGRLGDRSTDLRARVHLRLVQKCAKAYPRRCGSARKYLRPFSPKVARAFPSI
jgi:hypothetical protein